MSPRDPSSLDYSSLLHILSLNRWNHSIHHEEWNQAEAAARRIAESPEPLWKWVGTLNLAITSLYRGRSSEALSLLDQSARSSLAVPPMSARSHALAAHVLLESGRPAEALERARLAEREGSGEPAERDGIFLAAVVEARRGNWPQAEEGLARLERALEKQRAEAWRRDYLRGEIALARGEGARAVAALEAARLALGDRRLETPLAPLEFSLASAYLAAGDPHRAERDFKAIVQSGDERLDWPIPYVRSFYFLGRLLRAREAAESQRYYRSFTAHWGDGDLDRERVAEARGQP
jgi:tetratricopeptide (TPR) repeat protein